MKGHAIEVRINAEDPAQNFMPGAGTVTSLRVPGGPGTRFDHIALSGLSGAAVLRLAAWQADRLGRRLATPRSTA